MLWNRLKVIASEDISIDHPFIVLIIETLHKWYLEFKGKDESGLFLSHAILALCRSPKSRIADEFLEVVKGERKEGKKLEIPDQKMPIILTGLKLKGIVNKLRVELHKFIDELSKKVSTLE